MNDYEVVVPTRGDHLAPFLAGLIQWAPFPLRLITERYPTSTHDLMLLETLYRLGCAITLQQQHGGIGNARSMFVPSHYSRLVVLDDDVVVQLAFKHEREGQHPFAMLARALDHYPYAMGIIRFAQNFKEPLADHEEVWEDVTKTDQRTVRAREGRGSGWADRVYDYGEDQITNQLAGACFSAWTKDFERIAPLLKGWKAGGGDYWIGHELGEGVVLSGVYAYHFGWWSQEKWSFNKVGQKLLYKEPETYRRYARGDLRPRP